MGRMGFFVLVVVLFLIALVFMSNNQSQLTVKNFDFNGVQTVQGFFIDRLSLGETISVGDCIEWDAKLAKYVRCK